MRRLAPLLLLAAACADPGPADLRDHGWTDAPATMQAPPTLFPTITTSDFLPGETIEIVIGGMPEFTRVQLFATRNGVQTDLGPCVPRGGGCLDLAAPVVPLGLGLVNASGETSFTVGPAPATITEVTFQAGAYQPSQRLSGITDAVTLTLQDADGDGVATADDCDDNDPTRAAWLTAYADTDMDGEAANATLLDVCTDGTLPPGYTLTPGDDCDDTDELVFTGAPEVCDGIVDDNCDGTVDDGCPSNDPFNAGSCMGVPWDAIDASQHLAGRTRVVLDSKTIQIRSCPGLVCGGPSSDWVIRYLTYSGGVSTRWRNMTATMNLVLFMHGGTPKLSIQHTSFAQGGYPDTDGMVYEFPPSVITYPRVNAFNDQATGYDYVDLEYTVNGTSVMVGDRCMRWTAEPFGQSTTWDLAVRFEW